MADTKITDLTEDTTPLETDLLVTVDDPGGSPVNKKATIANVIAAVISAWAKAASKPSYTAAEVGAVATGDARLSDARTPVAHNQLKASITDFPASLPASDVSAWAKAASKPSYTAAEVGTKKITTGTGTTDTNKRNTVTHGLGTTPSFAMAVATGADFSTYIITSINSATFTVIGNVSPGSFPFLWIAVA